MYLDFKSQATQNFIPNLSGFDAMYCRKEQRVFDGKSCSSIVICRPGLYEAMQLLTKDLHTSEIAVNLSVSTRSERVNMSSKRRCCMMSWNRFLDIVSMIRGFPRSADQLSLSDGTLFTPRKMMTEMKAISSGRSMNQFAWSVCRA